MDDADIVAARGFLHPSAGIPAEYFPTEGSHNCRRLMNSMKFRILCESKVVKYSVGVTNIIESAERKKIQW